MTLLFAFLAALMLVCLGVLAVYQWVRLQSRAFVISDVHEVPVCSAVLLLGTAKYTGTGSVNSYFRNRIAAAVKLYEQGKIGLLILSGAGLRGGEEDEAEQMKQSLMLRGVPENAMILDGFGRRTWDSIHRCMHEFGIGKVVIVSQPFHTSRAIFIARHLGMEAFAFNADKVQRHMAARMFLRECMARVKCLLDIYMLKPVPAYLQRKPLKSDQFD